MRRILTQRGYSVIECEDGEAAVDRIRTGQQRVDLLIADVMLPKRSGREVADELRKAQPRARVLFISGYGEETPPQVPRLEKPFSPGTLAQTVAGIFEEKS
jgi:CheY-like chemotaxis protein